MQDVHPWLREQTQHLKSASDDGESQRIANVENRRIVHRRWALEILSVQLPSLVFYPLDTEAYEEEREVAWRALVKELATKPAISEGLSFFADFVAHINKVENLSLPLPPEIISAIRPPSFRSRSWFVGAAKLKQSLYELENRWERSDDWKTVSPESALAMVLVSAVTRAALFRTEDLVALANQLQETMPIKYTNPSADGPAYVWLDLRYKTRSQGNIKEDESVWHERQFFPDVVTLAWIGRYLKLRVGRRSEPWNGKSLWDDLKKALSGMDVDLSSIGSLKRFIRYGIGTCEEREGMYLSQAMIETATGIIPGVGMTSSQWRSALATTVPAPCVVDFSTIDVFPDLAGSGNTRQSSLDTELSQINEQLKSCVEIARDGRVRTAGQVISELKALQVASWPEPAVILRNWLLWKIDDPAGGVNAPSSLNTYYVHFGERWLEMTEGIEYISELTSDALELIYEEMVQSGTTPGVMDNIADRLRDFSRWGMRQGALGLPRANPPPSSNGNGTRVRAAFIPEVVFQRLLTNIRQLDGLERRVIESLEQLAVLAARGGLRPAELLKLRLLEIEDSSDLVVAVVRNLLGTNKTQASERNIYLAEVLTPKERDQFDRWLADRRRVARSPREAVFERAPGVPWSRPIISLLFRELLRVSGGLPDAVMYDFRHTCHSIMALIAEGECQMAAQLSGYELDQVRRIRKSILGGDTPSAATYWRASAFSGHASPYTLLSTYIHTWPLSIGLCVNRSPAFLTDNAIRTVTGWSWNRIRNARPEAANPEAPMDLRSLRGVLLERMARWGEEVEFRLAVVGAESDVAPPLPDWDVFDTHLYLSTGMNGTVEQLPPRLLLVPPELAKRWITASTRLVKLTTERGNSRMTGLPSPQVPAVWAPDLTTNRKERGEIDTLVRYARKQFAADRMGVRAALLYYLNNTSKSDSELRFRRREDLHAFLDVFGAAFKPYRWALEVEVPGDSTEKAIREYWSYADYKLSVFPSQAKSTRKSKNPHGTLSLHLLEKKKGRSGKRGNDNYSSKILRFIVPMLAIMSINPEQIVPPAIEEIEAQKCLIC